MIDKENMEVIRSNFKNFKCYNFYSGIVDNIGSDDYLPRCQNRCR